MVEGEQVTLGDSIYKVEKIYQLSNEHMKKYDLYHKTRVTLTKVSGNGIDKMDSALPNEEEIESMLRL